MELSTERFPKLLMMISENFLHTLNKRLKRSHRKIFRRLLKSWGKKKVEITKIQYFSIWGNSTDLKKSGNSCKKKIINRDKK